ncbi:hypothetical protein JCM3770_001145 [Rhodotorula araucariae]
MSRYTASFAPSGGLHPTLELSIAHPAAPGLSCALYTLVTVPRGLIADKYELQQLERDERLGASGDSAFIHTGEADLEAPAWRAGAARVLLRLRNADVADKGKARAYEGDEALAVAIPLHLRYQDPVERRWIGGARRDVRPVAVEWPWVFWACDNVPTSLSTVPCPPDSLPHLAAAFPQLSSSTLHFVQSNRSGPSSTVCPPLRPPPLVLAAPTGVLEDLPVIEGVTAAAVWACFAFLCWTAVRSYRGAPRRAKEKEA